MDRVVSGFRFRRAAFDWATSQWVREVQQLLATHAGRDGDLLHLLPKPVHQCEKTLLFSALVRGLGAHQVTMWALGRMEWLAF